MLYGIFQGLSYFLQIINYALLIYCVLSWLLPPYHKVMAVLSRFVDPLLSPIRGLMFRMFPRARLDFSALLAFLLLGIVQRLLWQLYFLLV